MSQIPGNLTGKQFEELVLYRARQMNDAGVWHLSRYGVQVSQMKGKDGSFTPQPMKSLPDFEAAVSPLGCQVIFDAKVCSQASFKIATEKRSKARQFEHMLSRSAVGASCFYLVHFNRRELKTRTDEAFTVALPVTEKSQLIQDVIAEGTKSISRDEAKLYGVQINWDTHGKLGRKLTPSLAPLIYKF